MMQNINEQSDEREQPVSFLKRKAMTLVAPRETCERDEIAYTKCVLYAIGERRSPLMKWIMKFQIVLGAAVFVSVAVLISIFYVWNNNVPEDSLVERSAIFASILVFIFTYFQWYLGRHEISYDNYYSKLGIVNQYIDEIGKETAASPAAKLEHLWNMRVFAQLDNLEYILGKYHMNYVDLDLVDRAVQTFRSECKDAAFCKAASAWINKTNEKGYVTGYSVFTRKAASYIIDSENKR